MTYSLKENQIVLAVAVVLGLYDFFTLPFNSFLVSCIFAGSLYYITKSTFIVAFVFFIPQLIHISNRILYNNEGMTNSPNEITDRIKSMNNKFSRGENLNPETPTKEYFTDAKEISERVSGLRARNSSSKVDEVSGLVDISMPSGTYPIEGNPSYPGFMREEFMGTNINTNNRIETVSEEEIKPVGTIESNLRPNNVIESYDDESLKTALARNSSANLGPSNMKSVDMTM
jgi:hypothetical protein